MRLASAVFLATTFCAGNASADDNGGAKFLQMFQKTCGKKPVSAEALDARARAIGYVPDNGPVAPDDPSRNPDDLYFAKTPDQGSDFPISAYFSGPRAHYQVSCSLRANQIDAAAFLELVRRETTLPDPLATKDADTGKQTFVWTADADGGKDKLEIAAYQNGRVTLSFFYEVIAR